MEIRHNQQPVPDGALREFTLGELRTDGAPFHIDTQRVQEDQPPHTHDFIELVYILAGQGMHSVDGEAIPVRRGDMLFINYHQVHAFTGPGMELANILLRPECISERLLHAENAYELLALAVFRDFGGQVSHPSPRVRFDPPTMLEVEAVIAAMLRESQLGLRGYQTVIRGYLEVLLAKTFRQMDAQEPEGMPLRLLAGALDYIDAHLGERITLTALARACFYNPSYFSRLFKDACGMTLTDYLTGRRIHEALRLLRETGLPAEAVASKVGYRDKKQFYAAFRAQTGTTPGGYRASLREVNKPHDPVQTPPCVSEDGGVS